MRPVNSSGRCGRACCCWMRKAIRTLQQSSRVFSRRTALASSSCFRPRPRSQSVSSTLKGSATFAILPVPVDQGQTIAVLEGAREEALARLTLAAPSTATEAASAGAAAPTPIATRSSPRSAELGRQRFSRKAPSAERHCRFGRSRQPTNMGLHSGWHCDPRDRRGVVYVARAGFRRSRSSGRGSHECGCRARQSAADGRRGRASREVRATSYWRRRTRPWAHVTTPIPKATMHSPISARCWRRILPTTKPGKACSVSAPCSTSDCSRSWRSEGSTMPQARSPNSAHSSGRPRAGADRCQAGGGADRGGDRRRQRRTRQPVAAAGVAARHAARAGRRTLARRNRSPAGRRSARSNWRNWSRREFAKASWSNRPPTARRLTSRNCARCRGPKRAGRCRDRRAAAGLPAQDSRCRGTVAPCGPEPLAGGSASPRCRAHPARCRDARRAVGSYRAVGEFAGRATRAIGAGSQFATGACSNRRRTAPWPI